MVTDSSGIEIVSNGPDTVLLEAREVLRLGVVDGGGPEQFAQVYAVGLGTDGRTFVANNGSRTVRVFGRDGGFLAEFGGRGEGPAEVSMLNDLVIAGDTVALIDWQRGGKVVLFDSDGTFLDTWVVRQPDGTRIQPIHRAREGWLASVMSESRPPPLAPGEPWTMTGKVHRVDFGSSQIGPALYEFPVYTLYGVEGQEGGVDWALFRPRTYTAYDMDGRMFITDPQAYRVDVYNALGLARSIRRVSELRRLTGDDVSALREAAIQVIDTMSRMADQERPQQRRQISDRMDRQARLPLPAVASPLGPVLVSPNGSFWVQIVDTSSPATTEAEQMFGRFDDFPIDETTWDLYGSDGFYVGTATLPAKFRAEAVDGFVVVGVWADDLDVEYVLKLEVTGPS